MINVLTGGSLQSATVFSLGVMPYISASIIFSLLAKAVPALEKIAKEGQSGQRKINQYTRLATVGICLIQSWFVIFGALGADNSKLIHAGVRDWFGIYCVVVMVALTAGTMFIMWLGEQITEHGVGNGISLIIMAGIVSNLYPSMAIYFELGFDRQAWQSMLMFLLAWGVAVVAVVYMTKAQRRIPIQQAKHTRGRRVYGGQRQYLPLRVNHGGVMPIIFAQSLMLFPGVLFGKLNSVMHEANANPGFFTRLVEFLNIEFGRGAFIYVMVEVAMIYFFSYFWTTVQFQPKEMANQLRDYGSFIPGLRPGKRTADYLEKVMTRITYVGAAFLSIIAVVPTVVSLWLQIPFQITAFLGGTGLLIVVSVALDMVQRIEANLLMRNYGGFLGGDGRKGKRIKGRQY
jgi:preprotein translocase subunit SecY